MLTKNDFTLLEKLVRKVVREEVANESEAIRDDIRGDIVSLKISLFSELREVKDRIKNLEIRLTKVRDELKAEIRKFFDFHDEDITKMKKQISKLEKQVSN